MNDLVGALVITAIFLLSTLAVYKPHPGEGRWARYAFLAKGGLVCFCLAFLVMFFVVNGPRKEMLDNAIRTPPDF